MSEWKEFKLGENISYKKGFAFKSSLYQETGRLIIRVSDTTMDSVNTESCLRINEDIAKQYLDYELKKDDIVIMTVGSWPENPSSVVGKVIRIPNYAEGALLNQNAVRIKSKGLINQHFLYYNLKNKEFSGYIVNNAQGSANQASITLDDIFSYSFKCPPLPEQTAIASILSSLDDKIDLLHRQNATLEKMAETLFRQWFVEEEWNGTLSEYIKVQGGFAFKSKDFKEKGFAGVIKIRNITMGMIDISNTDYVDQEVVNNIDKRFKITSGDFLIAMTGAEIGKIGIVEKTEKEIWVNQRVGKLEAKVPYGDLIGYLALKSREGQDHIINACAGSAQENISSSGIEEMSFIPYKAEITNSLGKEIEPLFKKIIFNQSQIRTLTALRDTLLPKLMSGEVRVEY